MKARSASLLRLLGLVLVCAFALQLYFLARIALMAVVDPQSSTFQRSEAWRLIRQTQALPSLRWHQQWVGYERISTNLKRAVIASEDAGFADHSGVEWDALDKAWERNQKAEARFEQIKERLARIRPNRSASAHAVPAAGEPKIVGGSTITQQLAKNLFLSGERDLSRKAQEFVVTFMLEACLTKRRILEIYLNSVEWGDGVFGAEAAAQRYFHTSADRLGAMPAAQLAVMLPAPKRFEKRPGSPYVTGRASTVAARMAGVEQP